MSTIKRKRSRSKSYRPRSVHAELKFKDETNGLSNVTSSGDIIDDSLILIAQGAGNEQRLGREIRVKSVHVRGTVVSNFDNTSANNELWVNEQVRICLVVDHQANGAAPSFTDVYTAGVEGFRNLYNTKRFTVLKDIMVDIDGMNQQYVSSVWYQMGGRKTFKMDVKCDIPVTYSAGVGVIGELKSNNIILLASTTWDQPAGDADRIQIKWRSRVRFYDS